ncbi:MAG: hypothetical protein HYR55_01315 [Acidobacteria bacterium]|nr:hypothetical protein [Acidobacteriota bacterium]MBI3655252.1 hypothetical protein [Acidobacteriota bacterium]
MPSFSPPESYFFRERKTGPHDPPKKGVRRELTVALRKQNLSIYDIEQAMKSKGAPLGRTAIWEILQQEGFARL